MRRLFGLILLVVPLALFGCGDDESSANNGSTVNNGANNGGVDAGNNGGADGGGNNGGADMAGNNGGSDMAGNNGGSDMAGNNGGTDMADNDGGTGDCPAGDICVSAKVSPNQAKVGDTIDVEFTELENFTFDPDNIGGTNEAGKGHYHVYLDQVDEMHELLVSGTNPDTFTLELSNVTIDAGSHNIVIRVHKNDHTEYDQPIEITIAFTVNE